MLVEAVAGELFAVDTRFAEQDDDVPAAAAAFLDTAWSDSPLAAVIETAPMPTPTWQDFGRSFDHLLASSSSLSEETWRAAADFAEEASLEDPVAGVLAGILVAASWQAPSDEDEMTALFYDEQHSWTIIFLPLMRSLCRADAAWATRQLCTSATGILNSVGSRDYGAAWLAPILHQVLEAKASATAIIEAASAEMVWRLADRTVSTPDTRGKLGALCWLLGDAARAETLGMEGCLPSLDCLEFIVRRSLAEAPSDPFIQAGWQSLAKNGTIDKSPELAAVYYRLTRAAETEFGALDVALQQGDPPVRASSIVHAGVEALLARRYAEVDVDALNKIHDEAKDRLWNVSAPAFVRLVTLLLVSQIPAVPTEEQQEYIRWELQKVAHGVCSKLWRETVDNVMFPSADLSLNLPFYFISRETQEEVVEALELLEAYRCAGLEYAFSVAPGKIKHNGEGAPAAENAHGDPWRAELRGLRYLLAVGRLPSHTGRYFAYPGYLGADSPLSPERLFDDERNRERQRYAREMLEGTDGDLFARPKGYILMRPGSGRVLIDFRQALLSHLRVASNGTNYDGRSRTQENTEKSGADFEEIFKSARASRAAGDLAAARVSLERAIALAAEVYGSDDVRIARASKALGNVMQDLGDYDAAQRCYTRALSIDESAYGQVHGTVAADRHNLGTLYFSLNSLQRARVQVERSVAIDEAVYGSKHTEVATDRMTLGRILFELGFIDRACTQYRDALAIRKAAYGPDHPAVVNAATALANAGCMAPVSEGYNE